MQHSIIARQPIVNAKQDIVGYEFIFKSIAVLSSDPIEDDLDALEACAKMLYTTMDEMQPTWSLGKQMAFINVDALVLNSPFLELMPAEKTVLKIPNSLQMTPETLAQCNSLKSNKFKFALDNPQNSPAQNTPAIEVLLPLADFVCIDTHGVDTKQAEIWLRKYKIGSCQLIAENVENQSLFKALQEIGYANFQGRFYAKAETLNNKVINPSFDAVLNILNLVSQDADNRTIENGFKRDTTLSYKLLRYINSVGFGLSCEVQSLGHALTILGRNQLYRWLTLLMVTAGNNTTSSALMKTSITRGRLTELLGEPYLEKKDKENLFVVGVFSLLDVILNMPMNDILEKLQLPESIVDALTERSGVFGPILQLTEACEDASDDKILKLAEQLHLNPDTVNQCHLDALAWTESIGA